MSDRFSRDSSSEIWEHLNGLDDFVVRRYASVAERTADTDLALVEGMLTVTTDTGTLWQRQGGAWARLSSTAVRSAPLEASLAGSTVPGTAYADLGISVAVTNPDSAAVWTVVADIDVNCQSATATVLQVRLMVGDSVTGGPIVLASNTAMNGYRGPASHTWFVTGLAAGPANFKLQAIQSVAGGWRVVGGSQTHMVVRQS